MEYTEEQKAILAELEEFIKSKPSQKEACRIIGISDGVISPLRKGTYEGRVDKVFKQLKDYFEIKRKSENLAKNLSTDYVETSVSNEIYQILNICQVKGNLAVICGDAGIGKTKAAVRYRKDHPTTCISITMNTCSTSIKSLLRMIAAQLNVSAARSNDEIWLAVTEKLSDGMMLIVDEAQFLTFSQLEVLRSFSDYFENRGNTFGVALVGNHEILGTMGSRHNEYAQIINRCEITRTYRAANVLRSDIQMLFPAIAENEKEIDFLWSVSKSIHSIRGAVKLYNTARQGGNCTYDGLVAAAEDYMNIKVNIKI